MPIKRRSLLLFLSLLSILLVRLVSPEAVFSRSKKRKIKDMFPFYPLLLQTVDQKPAFYVDFLPNLTCSMCHHEIYKDWRGSMHSLAFTDPYWQAMWRLCSKETGGRFDVYCIGCHATIGVLTRTVMSPRQANPKNPAIDNIKFGVQCDVCHSVSGLSGKNSPLKREGNASLLFDPGNVKYGPHKNAPVVGHKSVYSPIYRSAEFCGSCHNMFNPINNHPISDTYSEWKDSVYAEKGIICQDCHMATIDNSIKISKTLIPIKHPGVAAVGGPSREDVKPHNFVGANFTVLEKMGFPENAEMARKLLKNTAKLAVDAPREVSLGEKVEFKVSVTNDKAGHNLPTGLNELRQIWLDIEVKDRNGRVLFHTGKLNGKRDIEPGSIIFNIKGLDKNGKHTYKIWKIAKIEYDRSIPAKATATNKFSFTLPEKELKGPLRLKAVLRYRAFPQGFSDYLLGKNAYRLPILDMVSADTAIKLVVSRKHGISSTLKPPPLSPE